MPPRSSPSPPDDIIRAVIIVVDVVAANTIFAEQSLDWCDDNDDMEDADAAVVVALTIELALRKAIAPRSVRWENIIVLVAEAKLE